ncbi:hydrogenase 4 subunit B [Methyloceanibacter sp.]|uniref:hydrogenase 4 subunit B n=1 Tax=Methyloceanibacter sp. TaxID=1965321 RepID=UPI002D293932|nr:hydrogenase 4 subunit B [Methyloceanibacter sp.]HZP08600.1 hydrogenase 4 subunit B [Methyloceanibacter sp.]
MALVAILCLIGILLLTMMVGMLPTPRAARIAVYAISTGACATVSCLAALALTGVTPLGETLVLPLGLPWIGAHFHLDALSAGFLVIVGVAGTFASLYGIGYGRHESEPHRILPFYPAFLAGMCLVPLADDVFSFLFAWELMSLTSWALVVSHHNDVENRRAGILYLIMATFGTLALLLGFGLLAGPYGDYAFDAIRTHATHPLIADLVFALAILGAGSKAGLVPLHVWLPAAHPAAPSHVSGLMSGAMTKVAIYAFIRIVFDLAGTPAWWWGTTIMVLGAAGALLGILAAQMDRDLKRILAFSSVENIGFIFAGLGLALAFREEGLAFAAALAMSAALLHAFNHGLFKTLLFLGAGAILTATGERDIDKLGGLIHRMGATALTFLIGAAAISALPPLNGFASEWLTFQAILLSPSLSHWGLRLVAPAMGAALALAAVLAAAAFVRAFGISFLGRPRSKAAENAHEVDRFSRTAMFALAACCIVVGVVPGVFVDALAPMVRLATGATLPAQLDQAWLSLVPNPQAGSSYNGLMVFLFMIVTATLGAGLIHRLSGRKMRRADAWDCGFPDPSPITQYTGGSFAQPVRRVLGDFAFKVTETVEMPPPGEPTPARIVVQLRDPIWEFAYAPVTRAVDWVADRLNPIQYMTIRRYLGMVFTALIFLLLVLAVWQ